MKNRSKHGRVHYDKRMSYMMALKYICMFQVIKDISVYNMY